VTVAALLGPKGSRGGAFYLHGEDQFRKEEALRALVEAHIDPATRDFNLDVLRGTEVEAERLASVLATPPMMAEWRVVVLREVEGLAGSKHAREGLLRVVADPPPGLALLISGTVPKGSGAKFYSELARGARSLEFKAISEADVPGWLLARASERHGVEMDLDAARALGGAIGPNLGVLTQELEKLATLVGDQGRITLDDVRRVGSKLPAQNRWAWFDLVGDRRFEEARQVLPTLLAQGESGVALVIGLATHLLRIGLAIEGGSKLDAALPPYQRFLAKTLKAQSRRWTRAEVDQALVGLRDVDRLLKAASHDDEHFVETWLLAQRVLMEAA
jgi:DNA polymerase-3 subunit delta